MTREKILKLAEKRGIKIETTNVLKAKPLEKICGNIKAVYPVSARRLFCR